jgi:hypothetical protein
VDLESPALVSMKLNLLHIKIGAGVVCATVFVALIATAWNMEQGFRLPSSLPSIVPSPPRIVVGTTFVGIVGALAIFLFWSSVFVICYILPTIVAMTRNHCDKRTIIMLNLLLGWTGITWLVVIIWSLGSPNPRIVSSVPLPAPTVKPAGRSSLSLRLSGNE